MAVIRSFVAAVLRPAPLGSLSPHELCFAAPAHSLEPVVAELAEVLEAGARAGQVRACGFLTAARLVVGLALWTPAAFPNPDAPRRRRTVEALQDLLTYGRAGQRAVSPERGTVAPPFIWPPIGSAPGTQVRDALLAAASGRLNRCPAASMDQVEVALQGKPPDLRFCAGDLGEVVRACHARTLALFLAILDATVPGDRLTADGARAFLRATALSYLREDLQPLGPLVALEVIDAQARAKIELRWKGLRMMLLGRRIDAVAAGELRERHHNMAPGLWLALSSCLASGLWDPEPQSPEQTAEELAELIWLGLAPV